jgi:hypothetical protein
VAGREVIALMGESLLLGDLNLDRAVNGSDFAILAGNFGKTNQEWFEGDINFDGAVDGSDFAILSSHFGQTESSLMGLAAQHSFDPAVVPEPGGLLLLAMSFGLVLQRPPNIRR